MMFRIALILSLTAVLPVLAEESSINAGAGSRVVPVESEQNYPDGRPAAGYRLDAEDYGVVLHHGDGPGRCDIYGARDVWVFEAGGTYYMHYDAAGPTGWLTSLAVSKDLIHWKKKGPLLSLGMPGDNDARSASYGVTFFDGRKWHMFYLGTPNATPPPDRVPAFPYLTMKAQSDSPAGPWTKQPQVVPFRPKAGSYYAETASPGFIVRHENEYLQFFSASMPRTLSIARTRDLDGPWAVDPRPILPREEQIENSSLYFEPHHHTWFLFTNHVGIQPGGLEYTDAIWAYWSKDLNRWDPARKAIVLDGGNCRWSREIIGLPSVLRLGDRLAVFYDGNGEIKMPEGVKSHMNRDVGLAWLRLPLIPPEEK
jgi:predicted GH43/DUF377 family glycosyl hydrolase